MNGAPGRFGGGEPGICGCSSASVSARPPRSPTRGLYPSLAAQSALDERLGLNSTVDNAGGEDSCILADSLLPICDRPVAWRKTFDQMGKEIFEILAKYGFKTLAHVAGISKLGPKDAHELHELLWNTLYRLQYEDIPANPGAAAFRFLASRHLRGDVCHECRAQKLEFLGRFAALYSDIVIVPFSLTRASQTADLEVVKAELRDAIESLILLRALILAGIVRPAVMTTRNCCDFHAENLKEFSELTHWLAEDIASDKLDKFAMYYKPPMRSGGHCELHIEGPRKYFEHGAMVWRLPSPPSWVAKSWRRKGDGRLIVPPQKLRRTGIVQDLFESIANDTTFHFAYGSVWKAKYLTDLPGEAELLRGLRDNGPFADQNRATSLISAMTHALPFVGDLTIPEILKIRSEVSESFEQYRFALTAIIREHSSERLTGREAVSICSDQLAPKIAKLENAISVERRGFRNRVIATSGIVGIVVALGLFNLMPSSAECGLLGGALTALTGMLAESRSPLPEAATDDLYFLLRMKHSHRRGGYVGSR